MIDFLSTYARERRTLTFMLRPPEQGDNQQTPSQSFAADWAPDLSECYIQA